MYQAEITFDVDKMTQRLDALKKTQIPFASSLTINTLLRDMRQNYKDEMKSVFRNPVPFTLNSIFTKMSTKYDLSGKIGLKEFAAKGNPASKYLLPHIKGGQSYYTRFQKSLRSKGILAPNEYAIPTQSDYLRFNKYGNIKSSQYVEILYSLQAFRDGSAFVYKKMAKQRKAKSKSNYFYFAHTTGMYNQRGGNFYPGIYLQDERAIEDKESAVFWIQRKAPTHQAKFPFQQIGIDYAQKNFQKVFGQSLARSL